MAQKTNQEANLTTRVADRRRQAEALIREFNMQWVQLCAGHEVELTTMTPELGQSIRTAVAPFLDRGDRLIPRFEIWGRIKVFSNLQNFATSNKPVTGEEELPARNGWRRYDGVELRIPAEIIVVRFTLSPDLGQVTDAKFSIKRT